MSKAMVSRTSSQPTATDATQSAPDEWRDVNLAIVTPALGEVTVGYCISMLALTRHLRALNITHGTCIQPGCTLLAEARSTFVASFLASKGTYLLMIDGDVEFAPEVIIRLLKADRDIIGAGVPSKRLNLDRVVSAARAGHPDPAVLSQEFDTSFAGASSDLREGVVEVEWLATGLVLLKRAALERMVAGYPELTSRTGLYPQGPICFLFQQLIENGEIVGEDVSFFKRWRRLGGKVHLLVDADIGHTGRFTFVGNFARRSAAAAQGPGAPPLAVRPSAPLASTPARQKGPRVGPDDPCPCGSGLQVKKCHGKESSGSQADG